MKLTFCSASDTEYVRTWIGKSEDLAGKYVVVEKRPRVPLMLNVQKIRLAFWNPEKVTEFFDLEAKYLPVAGFTGDDFKPGELDQHEQGWNIRLSLSLPHWPPTRRQRGTWIWSINTSFR